MPNLLVAGGASAAAKAKQRLESGPGLSTPVGAKDELIKVDLKLLVADTVVSAHKPILEVADHPVGKRNNGLGALPQPEPGRLRSGEVLVAGRGQPLETLEAVGVDRGAAVMFLVTKSSIVAPAKSGITSMRTRPDARPRRSTATSTSAASIDDGQLWRKPSRDRTWDRRSHSASDTLSGSPRTLPRWRTASETAGGSLGTVAWPPANSTRCGVLKQADKHKSSSSKSRLDLPTAAPKIPDDD